MSSSSTTFNIMKNNQNCEILKESVSFEEAKNFINNIKSEYTNGIWFGGDQNSFGKDKTNFGCEQYVYIPSDNNTPFVIDIVQVCA